MSDLCETGQLGFEAGDGVGVGRGIGGAILSLAFLQAAGEMFRIPGLCCPRM